MRFPADLLQNRLKQAQRLLHQGVPLTEKIANRRRTPRYPFVAVAELVEKGTQVGLSARVTELSLYGCYVETTDPLAQGTELKIKLYANGKFFEAHAVIVYSQPKLGFGLSFQNVNPHFLSVLRQWLIEAAQTRFAKPV